MASNFPLKETTEYHVSIYVNKIETSKHMPNSYGDVPKDEPIVKETDLLNVSLVGTNLDLVRAKIHAHIDLAGEE